MGRDARVNLVAELHAVAKTLEDRRIPYAVCGGLAVTIWGATRTTKDIDILVPVERLTEVLEAVRPLGYIFAALPMTFDAGTSKERRVQRVTKVEGSDHLILDLILADAAFEGLLEDRLEMNLPLGPLAVISRKGLVAMKRLAGRPQDLADLMHLEVGDD